MFQLQLHRQVFTTTISKNCSVYFMYSLKLKYFFKIEYSIKSVKYYKSNFLKKKHTFLA
jgi:hypothetical protein